MGLQLGMGWRWVRMGLRMGIGMGMRLLFFFCDGTGSHLCGKTTPSYISADEISNQVTQAIFVTVRGCICFREVKWNNTLARQCSDH